MSNTKQIITKKSKSTRRIVFRIVDKFDSDDEPIGSLIGRKTIKKLPVKRTYFLPDVLWDYVKQYAGIYNFQINWDRKWSGVSAHHMFAKYCPSVKKMTQMGFGNLGKNTPDIARRMVWKDLNKIHDIYDYAGRVIGNNKQLALEILEHNFPLFQLPEWIKTGIDVEWNRCSYANDQTVCCGKVVKITDKNITIDIYNGVCHFHTSDQYQGGATRQQYIWTTVNGRSTFATNKGFRPRGYNRNSSFERDPKTGALLKSKPEFVKRENDGYTYTLYYD